MDFLRSLFCKKTEPIKDISDKEQKLLENKDKNTVDVVKQNPINENEEIALLSDETDAAKKAQAGNPLSIRVVGRKKSRLNKRCVVCS